VSARPPLFQRYWPAADGAPVGTLLVIHGLSEHGGRYEKLAAALGTAGYAVAAVDLYGHGESPGKRGHIRSFESDHLAAVDELIRRVERETPDMPLWLLGHSLGGLIAARWAQSRVFASRLKGLALLAPFIEPRMPVPGWKRGAARFLSRLAPAVTLPTGIRDEDVFRDPAEREAYAEDPLVQRRISAGHWAALTRQRACLVAEASKLKTPTLLQLPGCDRIVDTAASRAFGEGLPEARIIEYPGAYHALHHDPATPEVLHDLLAWTERRRAA
jgi:lysophospholipase